MWHHKQPKQSPLGTELPSEKGVKRYLRGDGVIVTTSDFTGGQWESLPPERDERQREQQSLFYPGATPSCP